MPLVSNMKPTEISPILYHIFRRRFSSSILDLYVGIDYLMEPWSHSHLAMHVGLGWQHFFSIKLKRIKISLYVYHYGCMSLSLSH